MDAGSLQTVSLDLHCASVLCHHPKQPGSAFSHSLDLPVLGLTLAIGPSFLLRESQGGEGRSRIKVWTTQEVVAGRDLSGNPRGRPGAGQHSVRRECGQFWGPEQDSLFYGHGTQTRRHSLGPSCSPPRNTATPGKATQETSLSSRLNKATSAQPHVTSLILVTPAQMEILKTCSCIHAEQGHIPTEHCMHMWPSEL